VIEKNIYWCILEHPRGTERCKIFYLWSFWGNKSGVRCLKMYSDDLYGYFWAKEVPRSFKQLTKAVTPVTLHVTVYFIILHCFLLRK